MTNCPNKEECDCDRSEYCECLKQQYLAILQRITVALGQLYFVTDYDPHDYERRIIEVIQKLKDKNKEEMLAFLVQYEIHSSIIAAFVSWPWLQDVLAKYYAQRVMRKYARTLEVQRNRKALLKLNQAFRCGNLN